LYCTLKEVAVAVVAVAVVAVAVVAAAVVAAVVDVAAAEQMEVEVVGAADSRDVRRLYHHSVVDHQMDC